MPPAKKQKKQNARRDSRASAQDPDSHSSDSDSESVQSPETNKSSNAKSKDDQSQNANKSEESEKRPEPYEYVCFHRPLFDVKAENWLTWSNDPDAHVDEEEVFEKLFKPIWEKEKEQGIPGDSPEKHPGHKWVMMFNAYMKLDWLMRKARYCNPDNFGMYIYNDWYSYGLTEILENMMVEFNKAYHSKGPNRLEDMWVIISAVGLWINQEDHLGCFMSSDDGEGVGELIGVIGCALLTVLAAIERAGELRPTSCFLDLAIVIGYYLECSYDLPAYGFEGKIVRWRKHAVEYFKKANLDPAKATAATKQRMEKIEKGDDDWDESDEEATEGAGKENTRSKSATGKRKRGSAGAIKDANKEEDTWGWDKSFQKYKKDHKPKMGGNQYDITKMSKAERKKAAFDGKDPFAGIPDKELKADMIDVE
ncbi:hypothetical protein yc1106_08410 [Curvularia clavata]|uniref:Uncharacterized protein n=1 Tax=Curvularia clavata TaxID=95742 RepID=A0A9Q8ZFG4_CURCL|nr:hypothetical protein yc1106_08410 [Curvularia clavata]